MTLAEQVHKFATSTARVQSNEWNEILGSIQRSLGQTDGDIASHFFSDLKPYDWEQLSYSEKIQMIRKYIDYEIIFAIELAS